MIHDFLILGHPNAGTAYMAHLMQAYGYQVGHEYVIKHGISDWQSAARSSYKPWSTHDNINTQFKHVIHVMREPIAALNAIAFHENRRKRSLNYRKQYVFIPDNINKVKQAVYSYMGWNKLIAAWAPDLTVALEKAHHQVYPYLKQKGYQPNPNGQLPAKKVNSKNHASLPEPELRAKLDKVLNKELDKLIDQYQKLTTT